MDQQQTNQRNGELVISEEVVAKVAGVAAQDVAGVAGLVNIPSDIKSVIKRDRSVRAIRVSSMESAMTIDIAIAVKAGFKLDELCLNVQKAVKSAVQNMVGRPVAKVNVIVDDIVLPDQTQNG